MNAQAQQSHLDKSSYSDFLGNSSHTILSMTA